MKQRLREFDFLRAFAALSVIAIHVTAEYATKSGAGYLWNQAMRFAVPLFIMLSGFLLYYLELGRPKMGYLAFLRKRSKKILLPYLIWTCFYALYSMRGEAAVVSAEPLYMIKLIAKHLVMGTGYVHLYFLLIMLQLYILYPLLRACLENWRAATLLISLAVTLFAQTMIYLHQTHVLVLPGIGIPYVSLFPIWLFYFVFGMLAAQQKERWEEKLRGKELPLALLWLISFGVLLADSRLTGTYASSIKPSVMLYCFTSFFFFYASALRWRTTKSKLGIWFDWLSTHSFLIFLLHPLLINQLVLQANRLGFIHLWSGVNGMLLLYAATALSSILITYLISFAPLTDLIGGVKAQQKTHAKASAAA